MTHLSHTTTTQGMEVYDRDELLEDLVAFCNTNMVDNEPDTTAPPTTSTHSMYTDDDTTYGWILGQWSPPPPHLTYPNIRLTTEESDSLRNGLNKDNAYLHTQEAAEVALQATARTFDEDCLKIHDVDPQSGELISPAKSEPPKRHVWPSPPKFPTTATIPIVRPAPLLPTDYYVAYPNPQEVVHTTTNVDEDEDDDNSVDPDHYPLPPVKQKKSNSRKPKKLLSDGEEPKKQRSGDGTTNYHRETDVGYTLIAHTQVLIDLMIKHNGIVRRGLFEASMTVTFINKYGPAFRKRKTNHKITSMSMLTYFVAMEWITVEKAPFINKNKRKFTDDMIKATPTFFKFIQEHQKRR